MNKKQKLLNLPLTILLFITATLFYGFTPYFQSPNLGIWYGYWGLSKCLANQPLLTWIKCNNTFIPFGKRIFTGYFPIWISALLIKITNLSPEIVGNITGLIYLSITILTFILLGKKLGLNLKLSLLGAFLFLFNPIMYGHSGYPAMMLGFFLVPLSLLGDILVLSSFSEDKNLQSIELLILATKVFLIRTIIAGSDWYATVICLVGSAVIFMVFNVLWYRRKHKNLVFKIKKLIIFFIWFGTWFVGILPWFLLTPKSHGALPVMPIDFFRGQGVDIITLFLPRENSFLLKQIGLSSNWNGLEFYGDGSNSYLNYIGYSLIVAFIITILYFVKKEINVKKYILTSLIVAGVVTFILSLGPSLKFNARNKNISTTKITFKNYLMPREKTILELPTKYLYKIFPFSIMRAVYRWIVFSKIVIIIVFLFCIDFLLKKNERKIAYLLIFLAIIEFTPNIKKTIWRKIEYFNMNLTLRKDVLDDLQPLINKNDKVFFLSGGNDYLAGWFASELSVKSFNGGGDKNIILAQRFWPNEIKKLRKFKKNSKKENLNLVKGVLNKNIATKIIIPYFSLRWDSYRWPPSQDVIGKNKESFEYFKQIKNEGFIITERPYFIILSR